jgi:hypothetical protein
MVVQHNWLLPQKVRYVLPVKSLLSKLGDSEVAPTSVGYSGAVMHGRGSERRSPVSVQDGQPDELVFTVDGDSATAVQQIPIEALGLTERAHLQEWVIAHPEII